MMMSFITVQEVIDENVIRLRFRRIDSPLVQRQEQKLVPVEKVKDYRCTFPENFYVDINRPQAGCFAMPFQAVTRICQTFVCESEVGVKTNVLI